ncbi:hypothetical protein ACJX0J_011986, partial [Zea mays]
AMSILGTLLGIPGKSKDSVNARLDMEDMGIRKSFNYCNMVGCTQWFGIVRLPIYNFYNFTSSNEGNQDIEKTIEKQFAICGSKCFNHLGELCWSYDWHLWNCVDFQIRDNEVNIEDGMLADENSFTVHATISIIAVLFSSTFLALIWNTTKYGQQVKLILQICESSKYLGSFFGILKKWVNEGKITDYIGKLAVSQYLHHLFNYSLLSCALTELIAYLVDYIVIAPTSLQMLLATHCVAIAASGTAEQLDCVVAATVGEK